MKRTKTSAPPKAKKAKVDDQNKKPLWAKETQGFIRISALRQNKVKPGEKIRATAKELGPYFKQFSLVENGTGKYKDADAEPVKKEVKIEEELETQFTVVPADTPGWFDVVDETGKVMNEKKLRAEEAKDLRKELIG